MDYRRLFYPYLGPRYNQDRPSIRAYITRYIGPRLDQDYAVYRTKIRPRLHQDYTKITPRLHQDYTKISTKPIFKLLSKLFSKNINLIQIIFFIIWTSYTPFHQAISHPFTPPITPLPSNKEHHIQVTGLSGTIWITGTSIPLHKVFIIFEYYTLYFSTHHFYHSLSLSLSLCGLAGG